MLTEVYKKPLQFMVAHASLSAVWNVAGVWLLSQGKSALDPTASLTAVVVLAVLILLYIVTLKKGYEKTFMLLAFVGALAGSLTIYGAFTKDPVLWPSEFWRYAGMAVNALALVGFFLAVKVFFQRRGERVK